MGIDNALPTSDQKSTRQQKSQPAKVGFFCLQTKDLPEFDVERVKGTAPDSQIIDLTMIFHFASDDMDCIVDFILPHGAQTRTGSVHSVPGTAIYSHVPRHIPTERNT